MAENNLDLQKLFKQRGYTLLSEYKNSKTKLDFICHNGHNGSIRLEHFKSGYGCPICSKGGRLRPDSIKIAVAAENYTLVSTEKRPTDYYMHLICANGHRISMGWRKWKAGKRCYVCDGRFSRINYGNVVESFNKEGYDLLSTQYHNANTHLFFKCPNGHEGKISWANWKRGVRCSECYYTSLRVTPDKICGVGGNKSVVGVSHRKGKSPLVKLACSCGTQFETALRNIPRSGAKCPNCDKYHSRLEDSIYGFLSRFDAGILRNRWDITKDRSEIDIVLPSYNVAVEVCGLYWHSELAGGKGRDYHINKMHRCAEKGYRLITLFEDEILFKNEIVRARLKNILGKTSGFKVYARDCNIQEISTQESSHFLNDFHIQGAGHSTIKLGAFFGDVLLSVMTFSLGNRSKGNRRKEGIWELDRYCGHPDYCITGVASKLLSTFERNYTWTKIFSYADRRWSVGKLYALLGFKNIGATPPNYWYIKGQSRLHRFAMRKNANDDPMKTEWENRKDQGWDRIWDCGSLKFTKERGA